MGEERYFQYRRGRSKDSGAVQRNEPLLKGCVKLLPITSFLFKVNTRALTQGWQNVTEEKINPQLLRWVAPEQLISEGWTDGQKKCRWIMLQDRIVPIRHTL